MPYKYNYTIKSELLFIITCCKTAFKNEDVDFIQSTYSSLDPSALIALAYHHGTLPLLYHTLKRLWDQGKFNDQGALNLFKQHYKTIAQNNMLMSAELLRVVKLLEKNDIKTLAIKGPTLAQSAYGDISQRQFGDLDILIQKKDHIQAIDLLLKGNFIPDIPLEERGLTPFLTSLNVIGFRRPSNDIYLELHWELLSKNYAILWKEEKLWHRVDTVTINHTKIPTLACEPALLYLCIHGAKHLFERLKWVCDIDRFVRCNPKMDWELLLHEADILGAQRMLLLGLRLAQKIFGLTLPKTIQKKIHEDRMVARITAKIIALHYASDTQTRRSYRTFTLLWQMREGLEDRLRFAFYALFAPKFDDLRTLSLPHYLSFLYPLLRPVRLFLKYFNKFSH